MVLTKLLRNLLCWLWTCTWIPLVVLLGALTFGWSLRRWGRRAASFWGRSTLAILGIELRVSGAAHPAGRRPRIAAYNHTSTLDVLIAWAVMPDGGVPIVKKEIASMPIIGWGVTALDVIAIDRSDPDAAKASLAAAAARINDEALTLFIAPEGTRSKDGSVGRFKLGALRIARASRAPIVPVVIDGAAELGAKGRSLADSGVIRVHVLAPVASDALTADNLRAQADELRGRFVACLAQEAAGSATALPATGSASTG